MRWFKKSETKTITFKAKTESAFKVQSKPYPAVQAIPEWWRDMTPYDVSPENPQGNKLFLRNRRTNATFKKCTPMLDALTAGYIIDLWADVFVSRSNGLEVTWKTNTEIFALHGPSSQKVPPPPGYDNIVFKFNNCWIPKTPPGYSMLITSPFGYRDLPFLAIPAVIDTDKSTLEIVPPMWIKKGFEGIVEAGTPLIQMIPFKRTDWKADFSYFEGDTYYSEEVEGNFNKTITNHYTKNHWSKKSYK